VIDWSTAPEWAKYHAFDGDGRGAWHQHKPFIALHNWFWTAPGYKIPSWATLPTGANWRESLTEKPDNKLWQDFTDVIAEGLKSPE
jgi:hypothetical protein